MFVVYFGVLRWCSMMIQFVKPWLFVIPSLHDDSISTVITMFFLFSRDSNTKQVVSAQWIWSLGSRRPEETESHQRWHSHVAFIDWLVVWNTCFLVINMTFHSVGNFITPTDFHSMIFQRGGSTTDQLNLQILKSFEHEIFRGPVDIIATFWPRLDVAEECSQVLRVPSWGWRSLAISTRGTEESQLAARGAVLWGLNKCHNEFSRTWIWWIFMIDGYVDIWNIDVSWCFW